MKIDGFINKDFMLSTDMARELYHNSAENCAIIDYHCHLSPKMIAENYRFNDMHDIWLSCDHYKWRAMRGNGVSEEYITGSASSWHKFEKWASTVPYTMRNPLYHWTHMELARMFDIHMVLNERTARPIYDRCNEMLERDDFRARALMERSGVEMVCTTDDPADSLEYHKIIADSKFKVKVLPTWRPDKALAVDDSKAFKSYMELLGERAAINIESYDDLMLALKKRHDFFAMMGCRLSDHGMDTFYSEQYTEADMRRIFKKLIDGGEITELEQAKFKSGMLYNLAVMDHQRGWVQQFHIGVVRNNNTKMFNRLGVDSGFDAIDDVSCAKSGHKFFDRLNSSDTLAKTIIYNLNPKDNEVLATMAYTFNEGPVAGKMQLGAAWWFLDQEDGMRKQINALSSLGLLSRFVGMLTDSRSFLSYPRHEYFRRILCDILGSDIEQGKLPISEIDFIKKMVYDISYGNAKNYFTQK